MLTAPQLPAPVGLSWRALHPFGVTSLDDLLTVGHALDVLLRCADAGKGSCNLRQPLRWEKSQCS